MKQNNELREIGKKIAKATWKSCQARIVGDEELVKKYEAERDELNAEWLRIYDAIKEA